MMYLRSLALILLLPCAMAVRGATVDEKEDTRADQPVAASFLRRSLMEDPPQGMRHLEGFGPVFDEIDEIDDTKARNIMKKRLKRVVANYNRNPTSKRTDQSISKFLAKLQKFFGKGKISEDQFNKISASFDNVFNPTTTTTTTTVSVTEIQRLSISLALFLITPFCPINLSLYLDPNHHLYDNDHYCKCTFHPLDI